MARLWLLLFLLTQGSHALAEKPTPRFSVEGFKNESSKYDGRILRAATGLNFQHEFDFEIGFDDLARTYPGNIQVRDANVNANLVSRINNKIYLENFVSKSTTSDIYAIWSTRTGVHYTEGPGDLGLGLKYDEFARSRAGTLIPSYFHSFSDDVGVGGAVFAVQTDTLSLALQLQSAWRIFERHSFRLIGAGGRTMEDAGLVADFRSVTTRYVYDLGTHWQLGATLVDYWSTVRNEKSFGLSIGYR